MCYYKLNLEKLAKDADQNSEQGGRLGTVIYMSISLSSRIYVHPDYTDTSNKPEEKFEQRSQLLHDKLFTILWGIFSYIQEILQAHSSNQSIQLTEFQPLAHLLWRKQSRIAAMEGENNSGLFANDGSFLERFKQLQQQQQTPAQSPNSAISSVSVESPKTSMTIKKASSFKPAVGPKTTPAPSNGKLAFSLKQKSKLAVAPVKLGADEDDEDEGEDGKGRLEGQQKKQKLELADSSENSLDTPEHAPSPPNDPEVKKVADKLASFVAKNGRQFENITRQKNPGDTPFRFLFDVLCPDYKYYEYRVAEEEKALAKSRDSQNVHTASTSSTMSRQGNNLQKSTIQQQTRYHTPASALYDASCEDSSWSNQLVAGACEHSGERPSEPPPTAADPVAMMEYYMKKAAQEERRRPPKQTKDEMPPPPSLQTPQKRGHHMGDYIPTEELEKFLATCNDVAAQKAAREAAEKAKIQADNVGHRLLSKMGWKEGEGLGSGKTGRADPVQVGAVKLNNLGVGAEHPGEVTPEDDIYEQYKKRMMLGYRYRPNPLNNPRKAYY